MQEEGGVCGVWWLCFGLLVVCCMGTLSRYLNLHGSIASLPMYLGR